MRDTPTVSIGLPVRNGAAFVAEAIESILAQTFPDFELVISDNASTDGTAEVCRTYAAADRRVRFYRQESNIGAAQNFNLVCHRSSGKYFKWAAHDDLIRPTYLARCVAALEADPEAVLCQSVVEITEGQNVVCEVYDHTAFGTGRRRQSDRLGARLRARRCTEVFGLIRREALLGTALIGDHVGADRTLLVELALRGRFVGIPEVLFVNRDHPQRFTRRNKTLHAQATWYAAAGPQRRVLRTWILYVTCLDLVRRHVTAPAERRRCYVRLAQSVAYRRRWFRLIMEPVEAIEPRAAKVERWLFGMAASLKRVLHRRPICAPEKAPAGTASPGRPNLPS